MTSVGRKIRVAAAGLGNCASSLIEGICHYRANPGEDGGLLFPKLCGYSARDLDFVTAFDISNLKVGRPIREAMYQPPNNFIRIPGVSVDVSVPVLRGPTLDGNPEHLARMVKESPAGPVDVVSALREARADVLLNLLPTGSVEASEFYARAAADAGCAFINCIPSVIAQKEEYRRLFEERGLAVFGDDIKSQMGTTILHRTLLSLLELRGAALVKTSQINVGGNTDFANFVYRAETKLVSKRKSLARYVGDAPSHVGHHYDVTRGPIKEAFIEVEGRVFGGSKVKIGVHLESDDKPNSAGTMVDLIRIAKGAKDRGVAGLIPEACAFYMKSPPVEMDENEALKLIRRRWAAPAARSRAAAGVPATATH
ncbi:MAG TPA: inositol-3-phosphate synthase [Thermodesulfobacteriota bacterium]|nr:inositol-3-phosphate synthase [Thermodesulfobacteriota bacterium]